MAIPERCQGTSLGSLIRGEVDEVNEAVFAEQNYHCVYEPLRSVRTKRWKYIIRRVDRPRQYGPNCDPGPSKDEWLDNGWLDRQIDAEQLYDLTFDPQEANNVASNDHFASVLVDMRARLRTWMQSTNDPLLQHDDISQVVEPSTHGPIVMGNPEDIEPKDVWNRRPRMDGYA